MKGWDLDDMRVRDFVNELLYDSYIAPEKGPAKPGAFDMETLEEYYGDTPWFQEYKKDIPFGHRAQRTYSDAIYGIGGLFNKLGESLPHSNFLLGP